MDSWKDLSIGTEHMQLEGLGVAMLISKSVVKLELELVFVCVCAFCFPQWWGIMLSPCPAAGVRPSTKLTAYISDTIGPIHMGLHIYILFRQNSAFHVFLISYLQCSPLGSQRSMFHISHEKWSHSEPISIELH